MKISRIPVWPLLFICSLLAIPLSLTAEVIFESDFSQDDSKWKIAGGKGQTSLEVQSGKLHISESGDSTNNVYLFKLFEPFTLSSGQGIRFTGEIQYSQPPEPGIGFGANKNALGIWAKDHTGIYKEARAYHVQFNPGAAPDGGKTIDFRQDVDSVAFQFNTGDRIFQPTPAQMSPNVGTEPFTFIYEISRVSDEQTTFSLTLKQGDQTFGPYQSQDTQSGQFLSEFSRIGMRIGMPGADAGVALDNLKLETFSTAGSESSYN